MKVDKISSVCSALKRRVDESRFVRAYNVYRYYKGSIGENSVCDTIVDFFQGMSFRRSFLKIIKKIDK